MQRELGPGDVALALVLDHGLVLLGLHPTGVTILHLDLLIDEGVLELARVQLDQQVALFGMSPFVHEKDDGGAPLHLVLDDDLVLGPDRAGLKHTDGQGAAARGKGGPLLRRVGTALDDTQPYGRHGNDDNQAHHTDHFDRSGAEAPRLRLILRHDRLPRVPDFAALQNALSPVEAAGGSFSVRRPISQEIGS